MKLTLGYTPCPNDTFMFDALVHGKIDTEGLEFVPVLEDVEALNRRAFQQDLDVSKVSYHAFLHCSAGYQLLNAGSALGRNCGPILVARNALDPRTVPDDRIGVPGPYTTANLLLHYFLQRAVRARAIIFSDIEDALLRGDIDAGVIIHENRFTYQDKGLVKIQDLGTWWESQTGHPIPLGAIVIRRSLGIDRARRVDRLVRASVAYAFANPGASRAYVRRHAQSLQEDVIRRHIQLYVTQYSLALGEEGRRAVTRLVQEAAALKLVPAAILNGLDNSALFI